MLEELFETHHMNFAGIPSSYYLIGLMSAFENRFQAAADQQMQEITWKQYFSIICISLCRKAPTLQELSEIMGSSHQNVKQILLKLSKKGFIAFREDPDDRRKQRIFLTDTCLDFCRRNTEVSSGIMKSMFAGISEADLQTTIATLSKLTENLNGQEAAE